MTVVMLQFKTSDGCGVAEYALFALQTELKGRAAGTVAVRNLTLTRGNAG